MKSFKAHLNEKYINNNKEYFFMLDGRLPLSPNIWKRLNKVEKVKRAYHTTDVKGLETIKKIQGQNKQISTFTRGDYLVAGGVETKGGVLIELSGESGFVVDTDGWTSLDRNGLRWWDLGEIFWSAGSPEAKKLVKKLQRDAYAMIRDIALEVYPKIDLSTDVNNSSTHAKIIEDDMSQEEKREFIKRGLDALEKFIDKRWDDIEFIIKDVNHTATKIFDDGKSYFNEIVLHNFKIEKVYIIIADDDVEVSDSDRQKYDGSVLQPHIEDINGNKVEVWEKF